MTGWPDGAGWAEIDRLEVILWQELVGDGGFYHYIFNLYFSDFVNKLVRIILKRFLRWFAFLKFSLCIWCRLKSFLQAEYLASIHGLVGNKSRESWYCFDYLSYYLVLSSTVHFCLLFTNSIFVNISTGQCVLLCPNID